MGISKSAYMRGIQCPKMLWLDKHKPEQKVIPPETRVILDAGNEFGDQAMGMFGPYEEMTEYKTNGYRFLDLDAMVGKTRIALEKGVNVICEASFRYKGNFCAVDILRKTEKGYDIYEVKNVSEVHEQFISDSAFQYYILSNCGLNIERIWIVTNSGDKNNPYKLNEITQQAKVCYGWVEENLPALIKIYTQEDEVQIAPGDQCHNPYDCWYIGYCHGDVKPAKPRFTWQQNFQNGEAPGDNYTVTSRIANNNGMPVVEGYPIIRKPMFSVAHEDPDTSEYAISTEDEQPYADAGEFDPVPEKEQFADEYACLRRKRKYPDGYDG